MPDDCPGKKSAAGCGLASEMVTDAICSVREKKTKTVLSDHWVVLRTPRTDIVF